MSKEAKVAKVLMFEEAVACEAPWVISCRPCSRSWVLSEEEVVKGLGLCEKCGKIYRVTFSGDSQNDGSQLADPGYFSWLKYAICRNVSIYFVIISFIVIIDSYSLLEA